MDTYAALRRLGDTAPIAVDDIEDLCAFVDARRDCADFRLIVLLRLWLKSGVRFTTDAAERTLRSARDFRYWMDQPGEDSMCFWSENHQVLFAACEYLAGQAWPDEVFTADGRTGQEHRDVAADRLATWLRLRFRFGFSEWLSPVYYVEDVAALTVLIDHAQDPILVARATTILDMLLLDCALHRFGGNLVGASGRCYLQKFTPDTADIRPVLDSAFAEAPPQTDWGSLAMLFVRRDRYQVPTKLRQLAVDRSPRLVVSSHGLDVVEALRLGRLPGRDPDRLNVRGVAALLWSMEAFVHPLAIRDTMRAYTEWDLTSNGFLRGLRPLRFVPRSLLPLVSWVLNPVARGTTLQRADVQTARGWSWALSSTQLHQVRRFGDQQHLWQAVLPGGATVFSTHPGSALSRGRNATPSAWVGNGVNPAIGQDRDVLLVRHDLRPRRGFGEGTRQELSHLHLPWFRMDDTARGTGWIAGRSGEGMIGVFHSRPIELLDGSEFVQRGRVTGWAVVCADRATHGTFDRFTRWLARCRLTDDGRQLVLRLGDHLPVEKTPIEGVEDPLAAADVPADMHPVERRRQIILSTRGFWVDGRRMATRYPRYGGDWASAPRDPDEVAVMSPLGGSPLRLRWLRTHPEHLGRPPR